jgi:SAM-dependent methyltransferase
MMHMRHAYSHKFLAGRYMRFNQVMNAEYQDMNKEHPLMLRTEQLEQCPICGSDALRHLLTAPDYESNSGEYGIDECAECSVAFTNPRPLEQELPKLYAQRSSADFPHMGGFVRWLRDYAIDHYVSRQLSDLAASSEGTTTVLDYGCGDGALARGVLRFGRKHNRALHVTAVDFHQVAPPALIDAGPTVSYQVNAAWHRDPGRYDAIFLRHVLEHHPHPLRLLSNLINALRPGGRLYIEVPNRRSVWARIFGRYYAGYYLPRHLFHFDRDSLEGALRRAGFQEARVRLAHHPMIGGSLRYLTGFGTGNTNLVGLAGYPLQIALDALFGHSTTLLATAVSHG